MAEISAYPSTAEGGPVPTKQVDYHPDYEVIRYEMEDGGGAVNVRPCGPVRVVLGYEGLEESEAELLDDHYALAKGKTNTFDYFDRRAGVTYTGVRYEEFEIPQHEKYWIRRRTITLIRED